MQTPYLIFKPKILEKNYREFEILCKKYLVDYMIAYSVKTNSFPLALKKLAALGAGFEAASLDEINAVKNFKTLKIFNGPCKTEEELQKAVKENYCINIDSLSEIEKLLKLSIKPRNIGLRASLQKSKFGFDETSLAEAIEIAEAKNLSIIGLHIHLGTQQTLVEFEKNLSGLYDYLKRFFGKYDEKIHLEYIDIGSGFPDNFKLKNLGYSLEEYFKSIAEHFANMQKQHGFKIIVEPGRFLVSDAFDLIAQVNVIKKTFDETYAIINAGINILPKISLSQFKFSKLADKPEKSSVRKQEYILAGPLLFNNDILGKFHGNLKEGDLIKIENVGAYCYNLAWEISYKKPEIIVQ